jgi:hypothetical protein
MKKSSRILAFGSVICSLLLAGSAFADRGNRGGGGGGRAGGGGGARVFTGGGGFHGGGFGGRGGGAFAGSGAGRSFAFNHGGSFTHSSTIGLMHSFPASHGVGNFADSRFQGRFANSGNWHHGDFSGHGHDDFGWHHHDHDHDHGFWNGHHWCWFNGGWVVVDSYPWLWGGGYPYYGYGYGYGYPSYYDTGSDNYSGGNYDSGGSGNYSDNESIEQQVQSALYHEGYYHGPIDGIVGPKTSAAISDYQRDNGLTVTGTINHRLLTSMGIQ